MASMARLLINNQHALIDIQNLSPGIYFVKVNTGSKNTHVKLVKGS